MIFRAVSLACLIVATAPAQTAGSPAAPKPTPWILQESGSSASLRGIHAVGDGKVAWASGTEGTVLRTEDGGAKWQTCAVPKGAGKLDFRGVWAWNANTAMVLSSGPGDASRIYKTIDGCKTWSLKYTNLEEKGFWDGLIFATDRQGFVLGDPVDKAFRIYTTRDQGETWFLEDDPGLEADGKSQGAFAASNSALTANGSLFFFGSGGTGGAHVSYSYARCATGLDAAAGCAQAWQQVAVPLAGGTAASGVFSVGAQVKVFAGGNLKTYAIAVGGNYEKPAETAGTAAYSLDGGKTWAAATVPPHGYRSAVELDRQSRVWITVGTNGSDFSRDDGKTWQPLDDGTWNALSLPWVVGPRGRIAKLATNAIPPAAK